MQVVGPEGSTKLAYGFVSGVYGCAGTGNTDEVSILTFSSFALSAPTHELANLVSKH